MHGMRRTFAGAVPLFGLAVAFSACGGSSSAGTTAAQTVTVSQPQGPTATLVKIPGEDRFAPFAAVVAPNGTVTFTNTDTDEHTITNLPGATVTFDLHVKANESKTLSLPAGVYRYYCTIHAKYVTATDQVAALPSSGFPDQPMEGVLTFG